MVRWILNKFIFRFISVVLLQVCCKLMYTSFFFFLWYYLFGFYSYKRFENFGLPNPPNCRRTFLLFGFYSYTGFENFGLPNPPNCRRTFLAEIKKCVFQHASLPTEDSLASSRTWNQKLATIQIHVCMYWSTIPSNSNEFIATSFFRPQLLRHWFTIFISGGMANRSNKVTVLKKCGQL